ncbi:uncharacterized protein LOC107669462 [Sinocyclocheilus anshuiensis]|uniref:Uncharacterized LOC107669462 n=1 Tax=Sinocyclocheilus anshuiensis TaxID=1608454 RepID=A0A671SDB1_9TELE|nr:PREDICTED: uncharacterized protein LOC107669462 [Sinocyclocheilus anshuiensis]
MHSQRLSEAPLKAWVIISSTGEVSSAHCTCMAGVAETCTHVGALLFKVEATVRCREMRTVTDKPAYWILPSNVNKVHSEVGHQIDYTSASATRKSLNCLLNAETVSRPGWRTCARKLTTPPPTHSELSQFYADLHKTDGKSAILSVLPQYCEEFKDPVQPVTNIQSLLCLRDTSLDECDFTIVEQHCQAKKKQAYVSEQPAEQIEKTTHTQHKSSFWFAARAGRITASNMHAVYATDVRSPALSTIKKICYPQDSKCITADLTWGTTHEEDARKAYIQKNKGQHDNHHVSACGFFINPTFPEIGASPDGVVTCTCCGKGCVEIKCPSKHKTNTIPEACLAKDFYLELVDGKVQLKQSHQYYTQVQTQIFVTNSNYCDFVVWTLKDCVILRIDPNPEFWRARLQKAQQFFIAVSLPEIIAQHFTKKVSRTSLPLGEIQQNNVRKTSNR